MNKVLKRFTGLFALLLMAVSQSLLARECQGVNLPDQLQVSGKTLQLNGLGLREATLFKVKVYVASLYLEQKSTDSHEILASNQVKRLLLHFVRDVGRDDITKAWSEGFAASAGDALPTLQDRIAMLNSWMKDMKIGDQLTFTSLPGTGVQVDVAGKTPGTIKGDDFARALFGIWLGATPPNPGLKSGLLGGRCG